MQSTLFNPSLVQKTAKKQEEAIRLATNSSKNTMGLTLTETGMVCRSNPPRNHAGSMVTFLSERHSQLWDSMAAMTLEELVQDFLKQINNRRVVQDALGDD